MRSFIVFAAGTVGAAGFADDQATNAKRAKREPVTLLGILGEWQYPGSKLLDGATMQDGGNPVLPSTFCHALLSTPDPLEKVVGFYAGPPAGGAAKDPPAPRLPAKVKDSACVLVQDDSKGRPTAVRVIIVNRADATTALVVSRAAGESATHIAWSHHLRHSVDR